MGWGVRGRERELSTMGKLERVYVVRSRTWLAMARFYSATTHPGGRFFQLGDSFRCFGWVDLWGLGGKDRAFNKRPKEWDYCF